MGVLGKEPLAELLPIRLWSCACLLLYTDAYIPLLADKHPATGATTPRSVAGNLVRP